MHIVGLRYEDLPEYTVFLHADAPETLGPLAVFGSERNPKLSIQLVLRIASLGVPEKLVASVCVMFLSDGAFRSSTALLREHDWHVH